MKKFLTAAVASLALMSTACTSVESTKVDSATIASNGDAVAVVQCTAIGFSALFHIVTITEASLDTVINKLLVAEAKALGGNKVQLLSAMEMPKDNLFMLSGGVVSYFAGMPPMAQATGIAVK